MNRFLIEKKLGQGAFGEAFLVKSNMSGVHYVMKKLNMFSRKHFMDAMKEVNFLKQLTHKNIVCYKEAHVAGNVFAIIMEYCGGGDLAKRIVAQQGRPFSQETIGNWFRQLCSAVQYIHRKGVLHRDIKPPNIFLTSDSTIKLGDFGIAKQLMHTLDRAQTAIGTPDCLAPEVWKQKPYDNKCDVWSLGSVIYELIELKSPPAPLPSRGSRFLQTIVSKMLEKKPSNRASIDEIIVEITSEAKATGGADWVSYRHRGVRCDGCDAAVVGIRYKCLQCRDYDLCMACEKEGMHTAHPMARISGDVREKMFHGSVVKCDVCGMAPMEGIWYKCLACSQYDLCEICHNSNAHDHEDHPLVAILTPLDRYPKPDMGSQALLEIQREINALGIRGRVGADLS